MDHEITEDGESTEKWAFRENGFMGSIKQLICCARCGELLPGGHHRPRKSFDILKPTMHFMCDGCYEALPDAKSPGAP